MKNDLQIFMEAGGPRNEGPLSGLTDKQAEILDLVMQILLSVLAGWSFIHLFTSAYGLTVTEPLFILAEIVLSVMFAFLLRRKTWSLVLFVASAVFLVSYTAITWRHAVAECSGIYEHALAAFYSYYGWGTVRTSSEAVSNVTWIMILFSLIPIWQTVYAYGKHVYPTILTFFFMMPLFIDILGGVSPSMPSIVLSAFTVLAMFFTCRAECSFEEQEMPRLTRQKIRFTHLFSALVLTAVLMAVSNFGIWPAIREKTERFQERYSEDFIKDLIASIGKNPFNISKNGLSEGNLLRAGNVVRNGKPVLKVTFGDYAFDPVYLRGFAADTYTKNAWKVRGDLAEAAFPASVSYADLYIGNVSGSLYRNPYFYYQASMAAAIYHPVDSVNAVTIEKVRKDRYAFHPYSVHGAVEGSVKGLSFTEDLFLRNRDASGTLTFPYYEYGSMKDVLQAVALDAGASGKKQPDGKPVVSLKEKQEAYFILKNQYGVESSFDEFMESTYGEYIAVNNDGTEIHYRLIEDCLKAYEADVRKRCLQVPEGHAVLKIAEELREEYGIDRDDPNTEDAVNAVRAYLYSHMTYSLKPGTVKSGEDFAEDFLLERKKGYCVHFATAGTLLLRALGVPARYVEGYLVPSSSVKKTQELTDYDAHAWAEVFIEGFGWYPVEFTNIGAPEEEEPKAEPEESTPPETETASTETEESRTEQTETSVVESMKPDSTDPESDADPFVKGTIRLIASILLFLLLAAAAAGGILYVKLHIRPLEKLTGEDNNKTCLRIYKEIMKQAERAKRGFSVDDLPEEIAAKWPEIPEDVILRMQTIVKAAYYSNNELSEEGVEYLYILYEEKMFAHEKKEETQRAE